MDLKRTLSLPFKYPPHKNLPVADLHTNWTRMFKAAEQIFASDFELQRKSKKGMRLPTRSLPVEMVGRLYAQYCDLINQMYDAYLLSVQLQRNEYIKEIISILVKRMYELRDELVHMIVNDYIYVDTALSQMWRTPQEIEIVVPYHFAADSREESVENMLQQMWADAVKRKQRAELRRKRQQKKRKNVDEEEKPSDEEEEIEEEEEESSSRKSETILTEDYINAVLIQKHMRYRTYHVQAYKARCELRRLYFAPDVKPPPKELMEKAARLIQMFYRLFMQVKRKRLKDNKRNAMIGFIPDIDARPANLREAKEKLYEKRRQKRQKINRKYLEEWQRQKKRLIFMKKGGMVEDITDEVIRWFKEWFFGYGFMPQYPYEVEGGTVMVVRGDFPTVEEQLAADEAYNKLNKNKTKEQMQEEKKQAKYDAQLKAELEKEKEKAMKAALFKARCNPDADQGYEVRQSENNQHIVAALRRYRNGWSFYDNLPLERCADVIYGYMKPLITEDIMQEMHYECRKYVDELMRLELKVFMKAHQEMYKLVGWKWPKIKPRPKPRAPRVPKPFTMDNVNMKAIAGVFDLGIVTKPTTKLDDVFGDMSYGNYELNIADPSAKFPSPAYGDVKRRLVLSCVFGSGIEPKADRKKAVMLLGIPRNGKSFLADAVAGELNAVKFDISPEVFSAVAKNPIKDLSSVFTAARMYQPSVIFYKNIERMFYKTVPPQEKGLKANIIKGALTKLLKSIPATDKIIFIATCTQPWLSQVPQMMKLFNESLLVPKPDYSSLQLYFYFSIQKMRSMPRDFCVQPLAQSLNGVGFGVIIEMFHKVMCAQRIVRLGCEPFQPSEFMEYLLANDIEPVTDEDYQQQYIDFALKISAVKVDREEYEVINASRAIAYAKMEAADAAKKNKAAKT